MKIIAILVFISSATSMDDHTTNSGGLENCVFKPGENSFLQQTCTKWSEDYNETEEVIVCPGESTTSLASTYTQHRDPNGTLLYSKICPNVASTFYFQACSRFYYHVTAGHSTAVCGTYLCRRPRDTGPITALYTLFSPESCNGIEECYGGADETFCDACKTGTAPADWDATIKCNGWCDCNSCEDEMYGCNGYDYGVTCYLKGGSSSPSRVLLVRLCDGYTDCEGGEDEEHCDAGESCLRYGEKRYPLTPLTRCLPWVMCKDRQDQTNCTDPDVAPLLCKVDGLFTNISKYVICKTRSYGYLNQAFSSSEPICDDGEDMECVVLGDNCTIHKHQLCDGKKDCLWLNDSLDENNMMCTSMSDISCIRKLHLADWENPPKIPLNWVGDGAEDCRDGQDEDPDWTENKNETCSESGSACESFKCPQRTLSSEEQNIPVKYLCDSIFTCKSDSTICASGITKLSTSRIFDLQGVTYISYCLPGIHGGHTAPCQSQSFPKLVWGAQTNHIYYPRNGSAPFSCKDFFGESYVFLSCLGMCGNISELWCKNNYRSITWGSCINRHKSFALSFSSDGHLVFVKKYLSDPHSYKVVNVYQCANHRCIPFSKVCNLVDDCGDGSDENGCHNNFVCNANPPSTLTKYYIPKSKVCDHIDDCQDGSDEAKCCTGEVINGIYLKITAWAIGTLAVTFNAINFVTTAQGLKQVRTSSAFFNRALVLVICTGDMLVGTYLLIIAAVDAIFGRDTTCDLSARYEWLSSTYCSALGVLSTTGSQLSLFAMATLSVSRVLVILKDITVPLPLTKSYSIKVMLITFACLLASIFTAAIPLMPHMEDQFVQQISYPDITILSGFTGKSTYEKIVVKYYGRIRKHSFRWSLIRKLVGDMFTNTYGGVISKKRSFYGNDAVCLFKYFVDGGDPQRRFTWTVLGINTMCFAVISLSYVIVALATKSSSQHFEMGEIRNRNRRLQKKISIIIATDFLCWMPFIVISLLHSVEVIDATPYYSFLSIVILPINSVINPLLYDTAILDLYRKLKQWINNGWRGKPKDVPSHTHASFVVTNDHVIMESQL